jgi:hypothetical protein
MNTSENHILLKYAPIYERFKGSLAPEGCHYDQRVGAWLVSKTGELFVEATDQPGPRTKKEDII